MGQTQTQHGPEMKVVGHICRPNLLEYRMHPSVFPSGTYPRFSGRMGFYYRFLFVKIAKSRTFSPFFEVILSDFEVENGINRFVLTRSFQRQIAYAVGSWVTNPLGKLNIVLCVCKECRFDWSVYYYYYNINGTKIP